MLFAKVRFSKVCLVFLFSVLSFNFSHCFNSQDIVDRFNSLDAIHKVEVGLAAGKLPTAILADVFAVKGKNNAALVLKSIVLATDVTNLILKTYRHHKDVSCFEYGFGAYNLFEIWNDIQDLRSLKESQSKKLNTQDFDQEEINPAVAEAMSDRGKSKLKKLACGLLKYSFLAADSATSIAFTLDEKEYGSYRNMFSWMNCWSKVLANSIKTKDAKVSSKVPVYLAGALISALYSFTEKSKSEIKGFVDSLEEPVGNYKKEKELRIKCFQNRVDGFLKIEKDSSKTTEEKQEVKSAREKDEKEIKRINKKIEKLGSKLQNTLNEDDVINFIKADYSEIINLLSPDFKKRFEQK